MEITVINPKKVKYIFCLKCQRKIRAEYHLKNKSHWIIVRQCEKLFGGCGFKKLLLQEEVDMLQPGSQLWDLAYDDPFKDVEMRKKNLAMQKEKRKEYLDKKYDIQFTKPWERKFVKDRVLKEDNLYGL